MMTTKRLDHFEVLCEWSSCSYRGHSMEELSDHMSLHLRDYLGDKDALEELDEYACLWKGCEFLSMGSPAELEVHAYFHNYHGKLKFVGSQLLKSRPDLPGCNEAVHSNNLLPEGSDGHVCQWEKCDSTFNNPEWFYRHVDNHVESAEQQPLSFQQQALFCHWSGCDAFFKIRYRLREHMRSHTQKRLVACPTCGSMFSSNTKLFDHLHRQAEPMESLVCEHCGKAFSSERLLRDHVRQHVNQVKCPFCDMTCTTLAALKSHIRFRHCDERPFPCDFCDKRFKNQRDLQKHTDVHNEGSVFHCSVEGCEYSCQTFQTMNRHFKRVHEVGGMSKYKCHICDKVFSWCYTLTLHLRKKHELKWPSGHSRFRYRKDVDGFLKLNMVRVETVEVSKEIMKNMAKKPPSLRKSPRTRSERAAATPDRGHASPPSSSSASSSASPCSSEQSASPHGGGGDSPVYCIMSTIPHIEDEAGGPAQEDCEAGGTSGAVQALTAVARGLGMDVV
ncbi:histone H4 transcription factor [Nerophis lumbriciformis]|uniref:histone H4 transcription factor n=1 Tax=Nerophis lumbriciformis TaxID=546530 RepID=UPI002ADF3123|nr:histone H4 transcription factor-like [Nerophis lumbriciformis]XP_061829112.1 histone H4 transcription factor-like [Nerophis lumbriciformis]